MNKIKRCSDQRSNRRITGASRSGGMLILVLVILGVGMILITSALSITIATRNRFYSDAQRSQAKLTVTSAAKSMVDAITVTQEVRDANIEKWAADDATLYIRSASNFNFDVGVGTANSVAPAIGSDSTGSAAYTKVTFNDNTTDRIVMEFETKIDAGLDGGATEKLKVVLKKKPFDGSPGLFPGILNIGSKTSANTFFNTYVGTYWDGHDVVPHTSPTNVVFLRGDYLVGTGGSAFFCDVVYTGRIGTGAGTNYYKNVVFLGDNAGYDVDHVNDGGQAIMPQQGYLAYIGQNGGSVFWKKSGSVYSPTTYPGSGISGSLTSQGFFNLYYNTRFGLSSTIDGFYYSPVIVGSNDTINSTYTDPTNKYASNVHNVGSSNTVSVGGAISENSSDPAYTQAVKDAITKYATPEMYNFANSDIMSSTAAQTTYSGVYPGTGASVTSLDGSLGTNKTLTAGNYKVTAAGGSLTGTWTVDLSGGPVKIVIYTGGGAGTLNFAGGEIRVTGGSAESFCYIFLTPNVSLNYPAAWHPTTQGIISESDDAYSWGSNGQNSPTTKPYIYVIGFDKNAITLRGSGSYLEGYCGLYGSNGIISWDNQVCFYGRYEATSLVNLGGSQPRFPFCPAPWEESSSGNVPLATKYEVDYYEYH